MLKLWRFCFFYTHARTRKDKMSFLLLFVLHFADVNQVDIGLASVYNDKILACPKSTYKKTGLPICANRDLPCGTILNVKRVDNGKIARCVVADRGPYGACTPSKKNTRACGQGSKWINGRNFVKKKKPMNLATWRGILDMSVSLARRLGVQNRLVPVFIYTDFANTTPSSIIPDDTDDPKIERNSNNIDTLALLEMVRTHENHTTTTQTKNQAVAHDIGYREALDN